MPASLEAGLADISSLVALVADFYWRCDSDGRFVHLEGAAVDAGAVDAAAWIGRTPVELGLGAIDRDGWPQPAHHISEQLVSWVQGDGEIRYLTISAESVCDGQGHTMGWRGLARDVTRHRLRYRELQQLRTAIDASHDMIFIVDRESMRFVYANDIACELTGHDRDTLLTIPPYELMCVEREDLERQYDQVIEQGRLTTEDRSKTREGLFSIVERRRRALFLDGRWLIVSIAHDISERKQAEWSRDRMSRMYASLSATNEAILRATTPDDLYQQVCNAAVTGESILIASVLLAEAGSERLQIAATAGDPADTVRARVVATYPDGLSRDSLSSRCFSEGTAQISSDYLQDSRTEVWHDMARTTGIRSAAAVPIVRDGQPIGVFVLAANSRFAFDADGVALLERMAANVVFALENFEHEAQRKEGEKHIEFLATHDGLTDLPNRTLFNQSLEMTIAAARRYKRRFALLFIDLDRFKIINDSLGHEAGDQLLQQIGERLSLCVRASDMVARLGGDEFVVLANGIGDNSDAARLARTILEKILEPVELRGHEYRVTTSIGIAIYPQDAADASALLKHADMAMYRAKEEGKNNFQFYTAQLEDRSLARIRLENNLRRALEFDEFELVYQAKLSLTSERIIGVEALLRWHSDELGAMMPAQFLPLAEEIGLIIPIGRWVLETACAQNMAWQSDGLPPTRIAVNLSAVQFNDHHLVAHIESVLARTGMPAHLLELEITETAVMQDIDRALALLGELKRLGVFIAIDDFGTGYSSLTQLRKLPVDTLKIDRSFVRDLACNAADQSIARAIITMGKNLSLNVIAEGVETAEQQAFLRCEACDDMQGFYFSRPDKPGVFAELLRSHPGAAGR